MEVEEYITKIPMPPLILPPFLSKYNRFFIRYMKKIQKRMKKLLTHIEKMLYTKNGYTIAESFWF